MDAITKHATIYSGNVVPFHQWRAENAAATAAARAETPRISNTGGYGFDKHTEGSTEKRPAFDSSENLTALDWLRVTNNDFDRFDGSLPDIHGILIEAHMDIIKREKGMNGYDHSAMICIWKDNDHKTVGSLAWSDSGNNKGGMFELTGLGCKILQIEHPALWHELYEVLTFSEWRISRVDVALDLPGEYAISNGYTVPKVLLACKQSSLFKSDAQRNPNMNIKYSQAGDWTDLHILYTHESYNPYIHCPGGLTLYAGSRGQSDDFFRIYEKGKELLGSQAEPEDVDRGWIRIEHEMTRGGSKRTIPLDTMLRPDFYWCAGRSGVRDILNKLRSYRQKKVAGCWKREMFKKEKLLSMSKKIHWAKVAYGRLIRTLMEQGLTSEEITDMLKRDSGLKEFIYDLADYESTAQFLRDKAA